MFYTIAHKEMCINSFRQVEEQLLVPLEQY